MLIPAVQENEWYIYISPGLDVRLYIFPAVQENEWYIHISPLL